MIKLWFFIRKLYVALKDSFIAAVDPVYYRKCIEEARRKERKEEAKRLVDYCQQ